MSLASGMALPRLPWHSTSMTLLVRLRQAVADAPRLGSLHVACKACVTWSFELWLHGGPQERRRGMRRTPISRTGSSGCKLVAELGGKDWTSGWPAADERMPIFWEDQSPEAHETKARPRRAEDERADFVAVIGQFFNFEALSMREKPWRSSGGGWQGQDSRSARGW